MRRAFKFSLLVVVLFAALSIVLLTATIYTYDRLTAETLIAELGSTRPAIGSTSRICRPAIAATSARFPSSAINGASTPSS